MLKNQRIALSLWTDKIKSLIEFPAQFRKPFFIQFSRFVDQLHSNFKPVMASPEPEGILEREEVHKIGDFRLFGRVQAPG